MSLRETKVNDISKFNARSSILTSILGVEQWKIFVCQFFYAYHAKIYPRAWLRDVMVKKVPSKKYHGKKYLRQQCL